MDFQSTGDLNLGRLHLDVLVFSRPNINRFKAKLHYSLCNTAHNMFMSMQIIIIK